MTTLSEKLRLWAGVYQGRSIDTDQIIAQAEAIEADMEAAAKDMLVPMPEPGTDMARLLSANVLLRQRVAELEAGLLAVLGPDHLHEYECEHGTPLGQPCYSDCSLNPTRRALGITGTLPDDAE